MREDKGKEEKGIDNEGKLVNQSREKEEDKGKDKNGKEQEKKRRMYNTVFKIQHKNPNHFCHCSSQGSLPRACFCLDPGSAPEKRQAFLVE